MSAGDLLLTDLTPATMVEAAARGILRHPTMEHRALPSGRGSGLAVVMTDAFGREHVYVTPHALALLTRVLEVTPCST